MGNRLMEGIMVKDHMQGSWEGIMMRDHAVGSMGGITVKEEMEGIMLKVRRKGSGERCSVMNYENL